MPDNPRHFDAGPDPFGRKWNVKFRWLQTAISIRHADAVDVKFALASDGGTEEEKVIALPHSALLSLAAEQKREITDPWCMRIAGAHLKRMIETFEDMEKTLVTVSLGDLASAAEEVERAGSLSTAGAGRK
jgi:hypothetical protein